nr:signal recognition particle 14 kda protein [Hymenolepis microstoma]
MESKSGKSLYITMKRHDGRTKPIPKLKELRPPSGDHCCLLRAVLGKKKISTVVYQKDMNKFHQAYSTVIRGNMDGLKKRDRRSAGTLQVLQSSARNRNSAPSTNAP